VPLGSRKELLILWRKIVPGKNWGGNVDEKFSIFNVFYSTHIKLHMVGLGRNVYSMQGQAVLTPVTDILTLWCPAAFGDFRNKKHLNGHGFAREYLRSCSGYGPGRSVKSSSLHLKKIFLLGEYGFFRIGFLPFWLRLTCPT